MAIQTDGRGDDVPGAGGVESINSLIGNLGQPTSETSRVIGAVAKGDLSP